MKVLVNCFKEIIAPANFWQAWLRYRRGKHNRLAVREFERNLEENLIALRQVLANETYQHGDYYTFLIRDPKERIISAPAVRDHLVHQAVYNILYPFFDRLFSPFSFSCRQGKGTQAAINTLVCYLRKASHNGWREVWILHGDIEKCFDSVDRKILCRLLKERISCPRTLWLLKEIIDSYHSLTISRGLPLGNLTSQLLINIYLDPLDKFIKERLRVKYYLRYADDFLLIVFSRQEAEDRAEQIRQFLAARLNLNFPLSHQQIVKYTQGLDVLGVRFLPFYRLMRPSTRRRITNLLGKRCVEYEEKKISLAKFNSSWQSINGLLKYGNNFYLKNRLINLINTYVGSGFQI